MGLGVMGGPACQSCGGPMMSDRDHGGGRADNPYCRNCTDGRGDLKPYDEVHRMMVEKYFMGMNGMPRTEAEVAARNAMNQQPAWVGRRG